jgi:hypothetical protein
MKKMPFEEEPARIGVKQSVGVGPAGQRRGRSADGCDMCKISHGVEPHILAVVRAVKVFASLWRPDFASIQMIVMPEENAADGSLGDDRHSLDGALSWQTVDGRADPKAATHYAFQLPVTLRYRPSRIVLTLPKCILIAFWQNEPNFV